MIFTGTSWGIGNKGVEKILANLELEFNFLRPSHLSVICNELVTSYIPAKRNCTINLEWSNSKLSGLLLSIV